MVLSLKWKDYNYDIDILKVGHHGSNTSTSKEFVRHFKPEVAIISVGRNNIYNHPHSDVIDTLKDENIVNVLDQFLRGKRVNYNSLLCVSNSSAKDVLKKAVEIIKEVAKECVQ